MFGRIIHVMEMICFILAAAIALCSVAASSVAAPVIDRISPASVPAGKEIVISGSGFALQGKDSEVIASYGDGFLYALKPVFWSARAIAVVVPDLGKSLTPGLQVKTAAGLSRVRRLNLMPHLLVEQSPVYEHHLKEGEKGEDLFPLQFSAPACGQTGTLFSQARVDVSKRRFADAQLIATSEPYCRVCKPLKVRWYNEPTGFIQYHIKIKRRVIEGICSDRKRNRQGMSAVSQTEGVAN